MIKKLIFILIIGFIIAVGGLIIRQEDGFAVFSYGDFSLELELIYFYFYVVAAFVALYVLLRLLGYLYRTPSRVRANRQQKHRLEIMQALEKSFVEADKFEWTHALHNATKHIKNSPIQAAQHMLAADYAHNAGMTGSRDEHLEKLRSLDGNAALANSMQSQYFLDDDKAAKIFTLLRSEEVTDLGDLSTLAQAYLATEDANGLEEILPKLQSNSDKATEIQLTVRDSLLWLINNYDTNAQAGPLTNLWKIYNNHIKASEDILHTYVRALCNNQCDILAEQIIKTELNSQWDETLIQHYGSLKIDNLEQRTKQAENWLDNHKDSAGLLLALGQMCRQQKLWGKAKSYLDSSLSRKPLATTYAELASLHEALDEPIDAQRCAKKGLHLATRR